MYIKGLVCNIRRDLLAVYGIEMHVYVLVR